MGAIICKNAKIDPYVLRLSDVTKDDNTVHTVPLYNQPPIREKSNAHITVLEKAKSSATLDRKKSSPNLNTSGKLKSSSDLLPGKSGGSKRITNGITSCSETLPWLLKQTKLQNHNLSDFEFGRVIGRGLMGTVRIAKTKNDKYVVFKSMRKDSILKHNDMRHVNSEKQVLNTMNCSFCIKLFGTFQDKNHIYLALEFAPGGELFHRLSKKECFSPEVAKFYISEIFVALEHIHSLGFVYRDLKPENIMLDEEGHCKLVDFGFCTSANTSSGKLHTVCGTPAYLSPEQLDGKFTNGYTKVVDWWSFGILAYELRTGKTPFCHSQNDSNYEIFLRVLKKRISFPFSFDAPTKELVSSLLFADLSKRLCEPSQIKKHSYFSISWDAVAHRRLIPPFVPRIKTAGDDHYFDRYSEPGPAATGDRDDNQQQRNEFFDF